MKESDKESKKSSPSKEEKVFGKTAKIQQVHKRWRKKNQKHGRCERGDGGKERVKASLSRGQETPKTKKIL